MSALTLGLLAWGLNDSGVSMPAMMLTIALPYTAILALRAGGRQPTVTTANGCRRRGRIEHRGDPCRDGGYRGVIARWHFFRRR